MFDKQKRALLNNMLWLLASFVLAFIVWITADFSTDPVVQQNLPQRIPIEILTDDNVIVTNNPTLRALVVLRAQETTFNKLTEDDIRLFVDLRGTTEFGTLEAPVEWSVDDEHQAVVHTISPPRITVELEPLQERLVELNVEITSDPPASVEADVTVPDVNQVRVSGPVAAVDRIDSAQIRLDLSEVRQSQELTVSPRVVDAEGNAVNGVTITPEEVTAQVDIRERSDVDEVRVTPNLIGEPPDGYTLTSRFNYEPQTVIVSGPPELLETLPGTLFTEPINLSNYTDDFEIRVPVDLPSDDLLLITGQRITVQVGIDPIITSRQFERIPIEVIGLRDGLDVSLSPEQVSVLVNGPQPVVSELQPGNIRVLIDLNEFVEPTTTQITPTATVSNADLDGQNVSVLPSQIDVTITLLESLDEDE